MDSAVKSQEDTKLNSVQGTADAGELQQVWHIQQGGSQVDDEQCTIEYEQIEAREFDALLDSSQEVLDTFNPGQRQTAFVTV